MNYATFHGQPFLFINEDSGEFPLPAEQREVDLTMHYRTVGDVIHCRFFNKDGSEAELCGNALLGFMKENKAPAFYTFQTKAGKIEGMNTGEELRLGMKKADVCQLKKQEIIKNHNGTITVDRITDILMWEVNVGNQHLVIMCDEARGRQKELLKQYNLHYITNFQDNTFEVRCFERGCGETQACGSGAYAVGSAMMQHFNLDKVKIIMKGGEYTVKPQTLIVKI